MAVMESAANRTVVRMPLVQKDTVNRTQQPGSGEQQHKELRGSFSECRMYLHEFFSGLGGKINTRPGEKVDEGGSGLIKVYN